MTTPNPEPQEAEPKPRLYTTGYLKHGLEKDSQGIITIIDVESDKVTFQGYSRQCIHCQYNWRHVPGSGILRGFCKNCNGHLCGKKRCFICYHKEKYVEDLEAIALGNRRAIEAAVRQQILREQIGKVLPRGLKQKRALGPGRRP